MKIRLAPCLALALSLTAPGLAAAQAQEGSQYRVTTRMEMVGMPFQLPPQTVEVCGPKDHASEKMVPHDDNCRITDFKVEGNKSSYTLVCTGEAEMTAKGEFEQLGPEAYRGKMNMVGTQGGRSVEMNMSFEGQRIGDCQYTPPAAPSGD
ncbi:DUF3617 domain-containing protein [Arenimonas caeni]|uniref:DUF3617 domain-containing protein n=1 Tax=Arenimonas caeni TaxID=2058085 RepID=A0A2P6M5W6_9GAMM|nr:DUF3617 family protein [Arenimonas caeni]PRH81390.1 hypothetical protein C6N40_12805 [Arenimonas caeni]